MTASLTVRAWRTVVLLAALAALAVVPAAAHERDDRAVGLVARVSAEQLVIETADGHAVAFAITPETRFFREGAPARREDVRVGQRAVVEGKALGERVVAVRVKLGVAGRRSRGAGATPSSAP